MLDLITKVKQVRETNNVEEANKLLDEGWILLEVMRNSIKPIYILGKIDETDR